MRHYITLIDSKFPDRTATNDIIAYGAARAKDIGFQGMKWEFSTATTTKYPGTSWVGSPSSLLDLATQPAFAAVFNDPAFEKHVINTFSLADPLNNQWSGIWNKSALYESEMYDCAKYMLQNYPTTFILQNWEGDWQLLNSFQPKDGIPHTRLQAYRDFHRARIKGIRRAQADSPNAVGKVFYCCELNRGLDGWGRRLIRDVIGRDARGCVEPDYVSFSAYEAVEGWLQSMNQAQLEADIEAKLTRLVKKVKRRLPHVRIALTEYGWPTADPFFLSLGYDIGALWSKVISVATALGIEFQIPWELLDNEQVSPGVYRGFTMYFPNMVTPTVVGALNDSGNYFAGLLNP